MTGAERKTGAATPDKAPGRRLSVRWKILIPFLVVFILTLTVGAVALGTVVEQRVHDQAAQQVRQVAHMAARNLERKAGDLLQEGQVLVSEARLLAGDDAMPQIKRFAQQIAAVSWLPGTIGLMGPDVARVVDASGVALLDFRSQAARGALADAALMHQTLLGHPTAGVTYFTDGDGALLSAAVPLSNSSGVQGAVSFGVMVSPRLLGDLGATGDVVVLAVASDHLVASVGVHTGSADWGTVARGGAPHGVQIWGSDYLASSSPVTIGDAKSGLLIVAALPNSSFSHQALTGWLIAAVLFVSGIFVCVLVSILVSRRLMGRVHDLQTATAAVAGGTLSARIEVRGNDEVSDLGRAFNTMAQELEERDAELAQNMTELRRLSETDSLTGLYDHGRLEVALSKELKRAQRHHRTFSLVMLDIDNFKLLNDTLGHPVGDDVLRQTARLLTESVRADDTVGRYGGDEFMLILPESDSEQAVAMASRIRDAIVAQPFASPEGQSIPIQLSFGVACYPTDAKDANTLMACADTNMYTSKRRGGDAITAGEHDLDLGADWTAFGMLDALVTAVDNKDRYTRRHSEQVTDYALEIAEAMGLSAPSRDVLRVAGLLHDVGKIGIPDPILRKPGRLTPDEYSVIKRHSSLSESLIASVPHAAEVRAAVLSHHERFDGGGYPRGLAKDNIPLLGRILCVADAFAAMTSDRTYRAALSREEAVRELQNGAGSQFDPAITDAFLRILERSEDRAAAVE